MSTAEIAHSYHLPPIVFHWLELRWYSRKIFYVLDGLGRLSDVKMLQACSMTCISFRCPSHSQIFCRVVLDRRTPTEEELQSLHLSDIPNTPHQHVRIEDDGGPGRCEWSRHYLDAHSEHLVRLLPMLPLTLFTLKFNSGFAHWNLPRKDVHMVISNILAFYLSHREAFSPAIVSSLVRVKHLKLLAIKLDKTYLPGEEGCYCCRQ